MTKRAFLLVVCLLTPPLAADAARPVTFDDAMKMRWSKRPRSLLTARSSSTSCVSGNPRRVMRSERNRGSRCGASRPQTDRRGSCTFDDAGATAPAWSPDGRYLSFLSTRGSSADDRRAQVWVMRADGGEAWKLTDSKESISAYAWSPDGKRIAFVSREHETAEEEARRKRGDDRRVFEDEFRLAHIWVVSVDAKSTDRITEGRAFTVRGAPSWSADSLRIAFAAAPTTMIATIAATSTSPRSRQRRRGRLPRTPVRTRSRAGHPMGARSPSSLIRTARRRSPTAR